MRNKTRSLSNLYCRSSCAFPGTVLFTFVALFITRTLLFNTNSGFFSRFSSFESLPSIPAMFSRTFHHSTRTLIFNKRRVLPRFSSSERFSSIAAAFAPLFIVCKFSRSLYHLDFPCAFVQVTLPSPSSPPFVPRYAFPFFSSFAQTSHSLSFSCAFCHSRLLHPS